MEDEGIEVMLPEKQGSSSASSQEQQRKSSTKHACYQLGTLNGNADTFSLSALMNCLFLQC